MMKLSLLYSAMKRDEIEECAQLAVKSFDDYDYFTIYFPQAKERHRFFTRVISSEYRTTFGIADFLVAKENNEIVAVSQLFSPKYKKPSDLQYLLHGWWKVYLTSNRKTCEDWLKMDAEAGAYCHSVIGDGTWYLSSLTIKADRRGEGIGSRMLAEGIIPYIRQHGGKRLVFFTNSESNVRFYEKQGFEVIRHHVITYNGKSMGSWDLSKDLD